MFCCECNRIVLLYISSLLYDTEDRQFTQCGNTKQTNTHVHNIMLFAFIQIAEKLMLLSVYVASASKDSSTSNTGQIYFAMFLICIYLFIDFWRNAYCACLSAGNMGLVDINIHIVDIIYKQNLLVHSCKYIYTYSCAYKIYALNIVYQRWKFMKPWKLISDMTD